MHRTIRIQIASDLHLEMFRKPFPNWYRVDRLEADRADLLVLAGDIHNGVEAIRCFADWPMGLVNAFPPRHRRVRITRYPATRPERGRRPATSRRERRREGHPRLPRRHDRAR